MKVNRRIPAWFFAGKMIFVVCFSLFLGSMLSLMAGVFLLQTRPLLYWTDWDLLGLRSDGKLECPKRLKPAASAEICLTLTPPAAYPKLIGNPQNVFIVRQLAGSFDPQTKLPIGLEFEFAQWFKPAGGQPLRWCRKVQGKDFTALGSRAENPVLVVVTAPVDFAGRISERVIGSCSILLEDPTLLLRMVEVLLVLAIVALAGLFWYWAARSLNLPRRGLWKLIGIQAVFSLAVGLLFWGLIGPIDLDTGAIIFTNAPGVYLSELRPWGWGILAATFWMLGICAAMAKIFALRKTIKA